MRARLGAGQPLAWRVLTRVLRCHPQVLKLRAALNDKEMELLELREQHMQLVVSSATNAAPLGAPCTLTATPRHPTPRRRRADLRRPGPTGRRRWTPRTGP